MSETKNIHGTKEIHGMKATRIIEGPGMYAYIAEALVYDEAADEEVYVFMNRFEGVDSLIVSSTPMFTAPVYDEDGIEDYWATEPMEEDPPTREDVEPGERIEPYDDMESVRESGTEYAEVFEILAAMITAMEE